MKKDVLKREGIREFEKDIRTMNRRELFEHFAFKKSRRLNVTNLVKNIAWQTYTWIQKGKLPPIDGNIRSFWYVSVKPVLSRLGLKVSGKKYTEKVYDTLVEMTTVLKLFRYADLGFLDERGHARVVGGTNGSLILFVEKDGLFGLVKRLALQYDTTGIALGGFPSYLTTEFLLNDMGKMGLLKRPVRLFSIVDYDPSGYWIETEFARQFKDFGVEVASVHTLVVPKDLPGELVEVCKYKLKKGARTKNWLEVTGGIGGEAFGLEADALGAKRIQEAFERAVRPYLKALPLDVAGDGKRLVGFEDLTAAIEMLEARDLKRLQQFLKEKIGKLRKG